MIHIARRLAALAGGLLLIPAVALVPAAPAHAQQGFGYVCDVTESPDEELSVAAFDCDPRGGAPATGVILAEFTIVATVLGPDLECFGGGVASTPTLVVGRQCVII